MAVWNDVNRFMAVSDFILSRAVRLTFHEGRNLGLAVRRISFRIRMADSAKVLARVLH